MTDSASIATSVKAFGVPKTAERVLDRYPNQMSPEGEEFFLAYWQSLDGWQLCRWLTRSVPEGAEPRPAGIVAKLVEWLVGPAFAHPLYGVNPESLGSIRDKFLLDEVIDQANGKVASDKWKRLLPLSQGWDGFKRIVELENQLHQRYPHDLLRGTSPAPLAPTLFAARREPDKCRDLLRHAACDREQQLYTLWVLRETGLLREIVVPEMVLDGLPTLNEVGPEGVAQLRYLLGIAGELAEHHSYEATVLRRILRASARGIPWGYLWWEIPVELRDGVGLASIDTEQPAPWAAASVERRLSGLEAWRRIFDFFEKSPGDQRHEYEHFHRGAGLFHGIPFERAEGWEDFYPQIRNWLIEEPFPEGFDEVLESRLVKLLRRHPIGDTTVAARLEKLPLTQERAGRLVAMTLASGDFYLLEKCEEIAEAAGPRAGHIVRPRRLKPNELRAYAHLVGDSSCFAQWIDEAIGAGDLWAALRLDSHDPTLRTSARIQALQHLALRADLSGLPSLHEDHPWLLTEADVLREFMNSERPEIQWERLIKLPTFLMPVLEAKTVSATDAYLAERLLERLAKLEIGPHRLADLAVERVISQGTAAMPAYRVAKYLGSGKLWAEPGRHLLEHFINEDGGRGATMWLADLVASGDKLNQGVTKVMHAVLAEVVIAATATALKRGERLLVTRLLRGLAELTVPPRLFGRIQALRKLTKDEEVLILIEANEGLTHKADDEVPGVDGLQAAIAVCADFADDAHQWRPS